VTIGAELYSRARNSWETNGRHFITPAATYSLTKQFGILFSIGHSFSGDNQSIAYVGLGWIDSFHRNAPPLDGFAARPASIGSSLQR
jgi:hypothetical protein